MERIRKSIITNFKDVDSKIETASLFKIVAFLDVTFNIRKHIFKPPIKNNRNLTISNIIQPKRLFLATQKWIKKVLKEISYENIEVWLIKIKEKKNQNKNRETTWFNLLCNKNVSTRKVLEWTLQKWTLQKSSCMYYINTFQNQLMSTKALLERMWKQDLHVQEIWRVSLITTRNNPQRKKLL